MIGGAVAGGEVLGGGDDKWGAAHAEEAAETTEAGNTAGPLRRRHRSAASRSLRIVVRAYSPQPAGRSGADSTTMPAPAAR